MKTKDYFKMTGINRADNLLGCLCFHNLVDRARDPLWEESLGLSEKAQKNAKNSCAITIGSSYTRQDLNLLTMMALQGVENDNVRKKYVPSSFKNSCPGIKMLNSNPVKEFHEMNYGLRVLGNVLKEEQYEEVDSGCTCIKRIV